MLTTIRPALNLFKFCCDITLKLVPVTNQCKGTMWKFFYSRKQWEPLMGWTSCSVSFNSWRMPYYKVYELLFMSYSKVYELLFMAYGKVYELLFMAYSKVYNWLFMAYSKVYNWLFMAYSKVFKDVFFLKIENRLKYLDMKRWVELLIN